MGLTCGGQVLIAQLISSVQIMKERMATDILGEVVPEFQGFLLQCIRKGGCRLGKGVSSAAVLGCIRRLRNRP